MLNLLLIFLIISIIPMILLIINNILSKNKTSREKKSPFECGFDPISSSRIPMSTQFFLVGLVFLIFDVEIALLLPLVFMYKKFNSIMILASNLFMMILILGLLIEYMDQTIDWKI
nr:TPA_asm: NADH dehydrogenase subunit 3 [Tetraponera rufonigra]